MISTHKHVRRSLLIPILLALIFWRVIAAGQELIPSKLSIQLKNNYPLIKIENPTGEPVIIRPISSGAGSIGFRKNGKIRWLTGAPDCTHAPETYTWIMNTSEKISLHIDCDKINIHLRFAWTGNRDSEPDQWILNIGAETDEYFTGIFERVIDGRQNRSWEPGIETAMDLHGERVEMKLKPTVSAYAPFYLSSKLYGIFIKGIWPGVFDFCKENDHTVQIAFEGPEFNLKLYFGTPMQIVRCHALETGPSFCPPDWAFGPWRWRDDHQNNTRYYDSTEVKSPYNSQLVEDVLMMKAFDIPCTAYWVDRPWAKGPRGFDDYEFDPDRFPSHEKMIRWINRHGMEFMIWIAPWVMGNMANEAVRNGYTLKSRSRGKYQQELIDFTHPEARKWWSEKGPSKLARLGIRGYKLDRADGEKLIDSLHLKTYSGKSYRENYNDYPRQYVKAAFEAVQPVLGDNFILYPRAQYTGSAKYGGLWAGDTNGRPEGLRSAIIGLQRCAVMGYPVWGSDTGGYWGDFSHETCKRWLAFSCFSPIMEVGPTNNHGFWDNPEEPHYDVELIATWRLYSIIRMRIQKYLYSLAKEASKTGIPIVRPLFLVYPDQKEAWRDWQTFMVGPDILVSAIWESGITMHRLYLPDGEVWLNAWNHQPQSGGEYVSVPASIPRIPVFIRQGSKIELEDLEKLYQESLQIASERPDLAELEKAEGWR
ncbi:alpha-glucosidase [bacterium]|nr:alpha-glucosidase [bacterium]